MKKTPYPHQKKAVTAAVSHFKSHDRAQLVMACGSGKSLTALWIAQRLKAENIIISVPKLKLQSQTMKVWLEEVSYIRSSYDILLVGSGRSVKQGKVASTTRYADIRNFLEKPGKKIIITTYQSSQTLVEATRDFCFDFGIIDEAHRTAGDERKMFNTLIFDYNVKIKKRLFMTATPVNYSASGMLSMDDAEVFGKCVFSLNLGDAINKNILTPYKILVVFVQDKKATKLLSRKSNRLPAIAIALQKAIQKYGIKKVVTFHSTVAKSERFQEIVGEMTEKEVLNISSKLSSRQRKKILKQFSQSESVITNPRLMSEGVDIPQIDAVVFGDIKNSPTDIIQVMGRALRKSPGKDCAYILLPVFVEKIGEEVHFLNEKDLDKVRYALTTIGVTDHRLARELKERTEGQKVKKPIIEFGKLKNESILPTEIKWSIEKNKKEVDLLGSELMLRTWNIGKRKFWAPFEKAQKFAKSLKRKGIDSRRKWAKLTLGHYGHIKLPADIPTNPNDVYMGKGWNGWGDFFGVKRPRKKELQKISREYRESRKVSVEGMEVKEVMEKYKVSRPTAWRGVNRGYIYPNYHEKKENK